MSEGEQMGRCRSEVDECRGSPSELKIAGAIDRLAADVASIKEKVDAVSPEDVAHLVESERAWAALVEEQRDAAIRERDQWREEARLAVVNRDEARAEVERLKAARDAPQPAAPAAGWLTDEERRALSRAVHLLFDDDCDTPSARTIQALLSRAGSPPVVVLPSVFQRSSLGDELVALQQVKDSLDKAGIPWKEVGRE